VRPALGQIAVLLVLLIVIAAIIAGIVFGIVKLAKYMRRREADRREMLDIVREQNRRDQ